jgi:tRNA uridine 5-carboxymethylaminomethyl modification enzyme
VDILKRPQISIFKLFDFLDEFRSIKEKLGRHYNTIMESTEILVKYAGYIERERLLADKISRLEGIRIKPGIEYATLKSISTEARQKLSRHKPSTIGEASRISGVSPADLSVLLLYMGR